MHHHDRHLPALFHHCLWLPARTTSHDDAWYIERVKQIVGETSGNANTLECRVIPRGRNFVRVSVEVTVESSAIIGSIYDELDSLEATVFKY